MNKAVVDVLPRLLLINGISDMQLSSSRALGSTHSGPSDIIFDSGITPD